MMETLNEVIHKAKTAPKREKIFFRVGINGELQSADRYAASLLEQKKYKPGDIVGAHLSKLRNIGTNKNAHAIAQMCRDNIGEFNLYDDSHKVLKRLQIESGAACEEIAVKVGEQMCIVKVPLSFSFDSLGEAEFTAAIKTICRHISDNYWQDLAPDQIEAMAERFVND